jgi:hypothetical protein
VKLKTGDKVRFLNDITEGTVTKILSQNRVEVTDSDGFVHATEEKNLVGIQFTMHDNAFENRESSNENIKEYLTYKPYSDNEIPIVNSLDPDMTVYAAVRLINEHQPLTTDVELIVVNNTTYTICFSVSRQYGDSRRGQDAGILYPRDEQRNGLFTQDELHSFNGFEYQFIFYSKSDYQPRPPLTKTIQFNSSDFIDSGYKRKFSGRDDAILLMPLCLLDNSQSPDISKLLERFRYTEEENSKRKDPGRKARSGEKKFVVLSKQKVVDLHIEELLKDYSGMNNAQIIAYQINYFLYEMDQALINKLHKITFIHGVGHGVLKSAIREELKRVPNIRYHDAPPEKFGYGATEVEFL